MSLSNVPDYTRQVISGVVIVTGLGPVFPR